MPSPAELGIPTSQLPQLAKQLFRALGEPVSSWQRARSVEGARALAASTTLAHLSVLDLQGNALGEVGVAALAERRGLRQLRRLGLKDVRVFTGREETYYDWMDTVAGGGPEQLDPARLRERFFAGSTVTLF